jgi:hypothetical protein
MGRADGASDGLWAHTPRNPACLRACVPATPPSTRLLHHTPDYITPESDSLTPIKQPSGILVIRLLASTSAACLGFQPDNQQPATTQTKHRNTLP